MKKNFKASLYVLLAVNMIISCSKGIDTGQFKPVQTGGGTDTTTNVNWPSPAGDVGGKVSVGYQGWFACIGDNSPLNGGWHWATDWPHAPSPTKKGISSWPDVRDY